MTTDSALIQQYFADFKRVIDRFPMDALATFLHVLRSAQQQSATVFVCGNGGSWATAAHMVCDFGKNTRQAGRNRMIVLGLGDNIPSLTAYANDEGYDRVFAEPALSLIKAGDVLIAISGSGNSPNVLRAVEVANAAGATTLGLTGFDGGQLVALVQHALVVPSDSMEMVEDFHLVVDHLLTLCLRQ